MPERELVAFSFRDASFRINRPALDHASLVIRRQRLLLEAYLRRDAQFRHALVPVRLLPGAPAIAMTMRQAALATGVGPMAAVAGAFAEAAGRAALEAGVPEVIVENGGDIFIKTTASLTIGLYAGTSPLSGTLGFRIEPERTPLGICSSSGTMGHSISFGACDLATVFAGDAALADAAATLAANLVRTADDIEPTLARVAAIPGILGLLLIKGDRIGLCGDLPALVKLGDPHFRDKITRHPRSGLVLP
jgi:hypothetical protein